MSRRARRSFTDAYKAEVVDLVRSSGKSPGQIAKDLDLTETAVREWVKKAEGEQPRKQGPVDADERAELQRLRDEVRVLRMERDCRGAPAGCGLVHHSDRGSQYASHDYRRALEEHEMVCSMSRRGDCWDNAVAESFWSTLKAELVDGTDFPTRAAARHAVFEFIEVFYNRRRLHSTLGYRTPAEFESLESPKLLAA